MFRFTRSSGAVSFSAAILVLTSCKTPENGAGVKSDEVPVDQPITADMIPSAPGADVAPASAPMVLETALGEAPFVGSDGADEAAWTAKLLAITDATVEHLQAETGKARRAAHSKTHGCVTGTWKFLPLDKRPDASKAGFFAQDGDFPVWIRFSNAFPKIQSDLLPDGRGMAIKVIDADHKVAGPKLLPGHEKSNAFDFPFVSGAIFPTRNIEQYWGLQNNAGKFFASHPREAALAAKVASQVLASPANGFYWSMGAFKLGNSAVKFSTRPSASCPSSGNDFLSPLTDMLALVSKATTKVASLKKDLASTYLRDALANDLANGNKCFDFGVQFQADAAQMPVEDPSVEWREAKTVFSDVSNLLGGGKKIAPFVKLATIVIDAQDFSGNDAFCERLSFNPWRTVAENRPLGNLMRARLAVYAESLKHRNEINHVEAVSDDLTGTKADVTK